MLRRLLTAGVGLPVILLAVIAGEPFVTILVAVVLAVGTLEFCRGAGLSPAHPAALLAAAGSAALAAVTHLGGRERDLVLVAVPFAFFILAVLSGEPSRWAPRWLTVAGAFLYVGWLGHHFVLLHALPDGRDWLLLALLATFAGDTGAYAVGMAIGRRRLAPSISPGKTWEGLAGGMLAAVGATVGVYALAAFPFDAARAVALGALVAVAAPLGDLAESLLKRGMGVKDISPLVPGHGGFLDRLDSLLFTGPVVYFFVLWNG